MHLVRLLLAAGAFAGSCALATFASAEAPSARVQAAELVRQGAAEGRAGRWQKAEAAYRAAWDIEQSHDTAAELGLVELRLGKMRDAAEHLAYSVVTFPPGGTPARRTLLEERLAEARGKVGSLVVQVNEPGAEVLVDGVVAGTSPLAAELFVEPGARTVAVRRKGYASASTVVQAVAGRVHYVALGVAPEPALPAAPRHAHPATSPPPPEAPGYQQPLLYSLIGLSAATLATGTALMLASGSETDDARRLREKLLMQGGNSSTCTLDPRPAECTPLESHVQTSSDLQGAAIAVLALGGAGAVATTVYGFMVFRNQVRTEAQPEATTSKGGWEAVRIIPIASAREASIRIVGHW